MALANIDTIEDSEDLASTPNVPKTKTPKFSELFESHGGVADLISIRLYKEELQTKINDEADNYSKALRLDECRLITETKRTPTFWYEHRRKFPNLYLLAVILYGIPSSSAAVER